MKTVARRARRFLHTSLWFVPLLCLLGGLVVSAATVAIDRRAQTLVPVSLTGSPNSARMLLSAAATSMMTLITLVLTVTTVTVQLAMGQFSPRIVRALLHDRQSQLSHGLFLATFGYALLGIREVENVAEGKDGVPGVTVVVAYGLVLASIVTLLLYVNHASDALRVAGLIDLVGDEVRRNVDRAYPAPPDRPAVADDPLVYSPEPGVLVDWDVDGLVEVARRAGCTLDLLPARGDFVPAGGPLLRVHDRSGPVALPAHRLRGLVTLGSERVHSEDAAYGFRKLVDIAERAVDSPFNDPTTAVQAIDRLHDCLRQLAPRPFPSGHHQDRDGRLRLIVPTLSWDGYVRLAFDEIRLAGASSPQVARRLRSALADLRTVAPPERQSALDRQWHLLDAAVPRKYDDAPDVAAAAVPDPQGIGSGPDVLDPVHRTGIAPGARP
ncbi:MAG: conserved rane protein of unknown function [Cryptosporangiaceae bacterium]|jgi:uncharacterized membrane protein|nr:conserved rane protein of unknown function [Cryptosporangiaceae bacterium]